MRALLLLACVGVSPTATEATADGSDSEDTAAARQDTAAARQDTADTAPDTSPPDDTVEQLPDLEPGDPPPLCQIALDCDGPIVDEPAIGCDLEVRRGDVRWYTGRAAVDKRGRSSLDFPKSQYAVELRAAGGETVDADLLGFGDEDDWVLDGSWVDRALFRDKLAYDLFQSFGGPERYAPEAAFCELTLDGDWLGIYVLTERPVRDGDRIDFPADPGDGSSFLVKLDDEGGIRDNTGGTGSWELVYPDPTRASAESLAGVLAWLDGYYLAQATSRPGETSAIFEWVDFDSAVDFVLLEELVRNTDAYYLSIYLWRDGDAGMRFMPWDLDLSLGQPSYNDNENPEGFIAYRPAFIARLGDDPAFGQALADRWAALRAGPLADAVIDAHIDGYLETMAPAIEANFEVWPIDEVSFGWSGEDYLYEIESYDAEIERVRGWLALRLAWMDANVGSW